MFSIKRVKRFLSKLILSCVALTIIRLTPVGDVDNTPVQGSCDVSVMHVRITVVYTAETASQEGKEKTILGASETVGPERE
ncbi:hypothetical protein NBRC116494_23470 [Aurantivibrio plasticivorans]